MAGGDLAAAIKHDVLEHGTGPQRRLSWYNRGRIVLLWVVHGLVYLHHCRVRQRLNGYMQRHVGQYRRNLHGHDAGITTQKLLECSTFAKNAKTLVLFFEKAFAQEGS